MLQAILNIDFKNAFKKMVEAVGIGRTLALCLLLPALYLQVLDPAFLVNFRNRVFDYYQQWQPRIPPETRPVAVLDIDEKSLLQLGQWPWPRNYLGALVQNATQLGAVVIGFDMVFAEEDRLSPHQVSETVTNLSPKTIEELNSLPSFDTVFANYLKQSRTVLGIAVSTTKSDVNNFGLNRIATVATLGEDPRPYLRNFPGLIGNLEVLDNAASGRGMISLDQGFDGVVRCVPLANVVDGKIIPTLTLDMLRVATGRNVISQTTNGGMIGFKVASSLVPTDKFGRVWIKYSEFDPNQYISAVDVITGNADPSKIAGKLLYVGTSATGLKDLRSSPLQSSLPGVEMHMQLMENILTQTYLFRPDYLAVLEWAGTTFTGIILILLVPLVGARTTMGMLMLISSIAVGSSLYLFSEYSLLVDVTYTLFISLLLYITLVYFNYLSTEKEKARIRTAFSHYLSPDLVARLSNSPESLVLGGEEKEMTFLFCDVRDFTGISEGFRDNPQGLTHLINKFLTPMTDEILQNRGTIDKYMGDSIMAFWNAPLDTPEHEKMAAKSSLNMLNRLKTLNLEIKEEAEAENRPFKELKIGIGLNTGTCIVGNLGSEQRFDYSVLGDPVNLASRLEGQSKTYGVNIIVGEETAEKISDFALVELDLIAVKGRNTAVKVYGLVGDKTYAQKEEFKKEQQVISQMLDCYKSQDWEGTEHHINQLKSLTNEFAQLASLYQMRIDNFRINPPGDTWDGIFRATTK